MRSCLTELSKYVASRWVRACITPPCIVVRAGLSEFAAFELFGPRILSQASTVPPLYQASERARREGHGVVVTESTSADAADALTLIAD